MKNEDFRKVAKHNLTEETEIYNNIERCLRNQISFLEQWNGYGDSGRGDLNGNFFSSMSILQVGEEDVKVAVKLGHSCDYDNDTDECMVWTTCRYCFVLPSDLSIVKEAFTLSGKTKVDLCSHDYSFILDVIKQIISSVLNYLEPVSLIKIENSFNGYSEVPGLCSLDYEEGYEVDLYVPCSHFKTKECKCS